MQFVFGCLMLFSLTIAAENRCKKSPRTPKPGCCPDTYIGHCCPGIAPCTPIKPRPMPTRTMSLPNLQNNRTMALKLPCSPPWDTSACGEGFYNMNGTVEACPPGFYCPELFVCILPCPLGAYCKQFQVTRFKPEKNGVLCRRMGMCCRNSHGVLHPPTQISPGVFKCPGMPHPDACPKGNYCPNTTTKRNCKDGHFCPEGSVEPLKCPILTSCGVGESAPLKNAAGPLLAAFLLLLIVLCYQFYVHYSEIKFYAQLYCGNFMGRERSFSVAYNVTDGMMGLTLNMNEVSESPGEDTKIKPKDYTIDISFRNLSLTLKTGSKKVVLSGVNGEVCSGEVTAVMGPSGAGKTTFLNALSGKAYYGIRGGDILVNGKAVDSITKYRRVTGFVPQEDTMHRKLTVREVLLFQGRLRLPGNTDYEVIKDRVEHIMELLEIAHVANVPIGDEETRGISGGQRKRVNIGMELIADPTLLFLDEPTSGLDSTSSLSVLRALRAVAEKGRLNVVCVIHQPRYEIFAMFHKLLFLGPGGRTVYQGTVEGARDYFETLDFPCPPNINPADHYMDVIGGVVKKGDDKFNPVVLFDSWTKHSSDSQDFSNGDTENITLMNSHDKDDDFQGRAMPNIFSQFFVFLKREAVLQLRYIKSLILDLFLVLLAGGVLGALYAEVSLQKTIAMNTMSSLAIGLTAILASLRCFGNHRTTFWRESASGVNRFSYFLAVNVCQLPLILVTPLVYLSLQYTFTSPRALFKYHYGAVLLAQFATTGIGYAISCIFNPRNSQMAAVVVVLISSLLSGSMPDLCQLNDFKVIGPIAYSLSYCRWFVEALFEKEVERYPAIMQTQIDYLAFKNNYNLESYGLCLLALFCFGIVFRIIAYLCLVFTNRGQQK
ncbi:uncharacterized protein LOC135696807 [Rhopilema esculentum]|uniref:uncharacterized protein LOC135696807 n=1 Tax=Rhopilema esculentum TaxID=499914 RepID=UPI0031E2D6EB